MEIENLATTLPTVVATEWQNYSDGSIEMTVDMSQVTAPSVISTEWAGQTKSTYVMSPESLSVANPSVQVPPEWVQYGLIIYSHFRNDAAATSVPAVTNTSWS